VNQPQLIEVDPQLIKFSRLNPRKHQGSEFDRLRQSVKEVGIVQLPTVRVRPAGFYEVIDGEGRVRSAQDARHRAIWVVSLGIVSDQDALTMLQSANSVRSFGFLAECKGLANLHRQGQSGRELAKRFGTDHGTMANYIGIGYFPETLVEKVNQASASLSESRGITLGYKTLQSLLILRQVLPGQTIPGRFSIDSPALDGTYDYREVEIAIEKIIQGEITTQDQLSAYVANRRRELFEQRFNEEMRLRLEAELVQTKQALEESYNQQLQGIQAQTASRYEAQVAVLRQQYDDLDKQYQRLVRDVAKRPEIIAQREADLQKKLKAAEVERERFQTLQQQVQSEVQKAQAEARAAIQHELSEAIKEQRKAMDQQLAQARADMEAFYTQKDQQRQLQAEKSVRQTVAHGTELLSQTQQWILHLTSPGFVKGVSWLPDTEIGSLLAQIMAVQRTLTEALEAIRGGMITVVEERKTEERRTVSGSPG
jgi:ParB-like chromosome segregation protein Spo0J